MASASEDWNRDFADDEARSADERIGATVGGAYRLTRHIGSGGSSHVFEAEHVRLGKPFAVKLLRPELDPTRRTAQRFRREARAIGHIRNEHVVSVVDCGELDDKTPYLVMELLEGEDLRSLLNRERSLPVRRAVQIIVEACRGLSAVHEAGLVHRDLKPENLFIARRSTGEDWCKVLDFGVAKMEASVSTAQGAIIGTVRYMAPEQLTDGASVGPAADIYALGAILYECLGGRAAHSGNTIQQVMFSVVHSEPEALSKSCSHLPHAVVELVEGCLAKSPSDRPETAAALEARALSVLVQPPKAGRDLTLNEETSAAFITPSARRRRWWMAASFGAVLVMTAGLFWSMNRTATEPKAKLDHAVARSTEVRPKAELEAVDLLSTAEASPPASAKTNPSPTGSLPARPLRSTALATPAAPRPSLAKPSAPLPPATPTQAREVTVGNFDRANPYSE